ncbi:hypothetical protein F4778DRAFT_782625 [Xylariomycetidae sp. FL2044]|nr:hypothetical protein F4778DRAFT_782625 [Xylariomycetidae sp. FL2044]
MVTAYGRVHAVSSYNQCALYRGPVLSAVYSFVLPLKPIPARLTMMDALIALTKIGLAGLAIGTGLLVVVPCFFVLVDFEAISLRAKVDCRVRFHWGGHFDEGMAPLNMRDTTFRPELRPGYLEKKMEHATRNQETGALIACGFHHTDGLPAQDCIGGMGVYSTPTDLLKLLKVMLAGGGSIISRASVDEMLRPQLKDVTQTAFMKVINGKARTHLQAATDLARWA